MCASKSYEKFVLNMISSLSPIGNLAIYVGYKLLSECGGRAQWGNLCYTHGDYLRPKLPNWATQPRLHYRRIICQS